jgi:hypothetical protein
MSSKCRRGVHNLFYSLVHFGFLLTNTFGSPVPVPTQYATLSQTKVSAEIMPSLCQRLFERSLGRRLAQEVISIIGAVDVQR